MTLIDWTSKSKNYTKGREGRKVRYISIHWIAVGTGESAAKYLLNNANNTSAHYVVENDNAWRLVKTEDTAHAVGNWIANTESISIEMSATPDRPASEQTYIVVAELIALIADIYKLEINENTIKPHRFFSPTQCPGTISIPKLIKLATGGTTESDKDKKIAELEKEKDKFETLSKEQAKTIKIMENDAKEQQEKLEALQKERDVFHDISERTSKEVKDLKISVEKAIVSAKSWEDDYLDIQKQLVNTNILYNEQIEMIKVLEGEKKVLQAANKTFMKYSTATKLFKFKNYSVVLIEDLEKKNE